MGVLSYIMLGMLLLLQESKGIDIRIGEELKVGNVWLSPGKTFAIGFLNGTQLKGTFNLSIWYNFEHEAKSVVWTLVDEAGQAVQVSKNAQLSLQTRALVVMDGEQIHFVTTYCDHDCVRGATMMENGNFVVSMYNNNDWKSFDYPTDTLLPNQQLESESTKLLSGNYVLLMLKNQVALQYQAFENRAYWSIKNDAVQACLDTNGALQYDFNCRQSPSLKYPPVLNLTSSGMLNFYDATGMPWNVSLDNNSQRYALDFGASNLRRLKLDSDGNLRMYSLAKGNAFWNIVWEALPRACDIFGVCGPFGICSYRPTKICTCPQGFRPLDVDDLSRGCKYDVPLNCDGIQSQEYVEIIRADFFYNDDNFQATTMSLDECKKQCMNDCNCLVAAYKYTGAGLCFKKKGFEGDHGVYNGQQSPGQVNLVFLKVASLGGSTHNGGGDPFVTDANATSAQTYSYREPVSFISRHFQDILIAIVISQLIIYSAVATWTWLRVRKRFHRMLRSYQDTGFEGAPTRFCYEELTLATQNFRDFIGSGGYGSVFMGVLPTGTKIAVKKLDGNNNPHGETQFKAEVSTIGRIHHINLVRLLGYCMEGEHRILVYEYMPNGSLDKVLFSPSVPRFCDWKTRYEIALGTAKGLAYLHEECQECILHCDIKPSNILLDERFRPKVADFGLAKNVSKERAATITTVRGTRGYLAPEWLEGSTVSAKVDVYSFGMVLLEIISGRAKFSFAPSSMESDRWYFPLHAYNKYVEADIQTIVDPSIKDNVDREQVERLLMVSFWCIQLDARDRPSMGKVVQMLEGTQAFAQSPPPHYISNSSSMQFSFHTSNNLSSAIEGR